MSGLTCCISNLKSSRKRGGNPGIGASQITVKTAPLEACVFIGIKGLRGCLDFSLPTGRHTKQTAFGTMSQQFPTTAQVIYDVLSSDAGLMSLIGEYTFRKGQAYPAISILTPGADLPSLRATTGVECIIHDVGDITKYEYLTSDPARTSVLWSVFLVVWEPSTGSHMQAAAEKICSRFLGSNSIQTVAVADGLGSMVQTKVMIRSDMPVLAA